MHLLVREQHDLGAEEAAVDLGHSPADLVLLSFSDSDLGAAASAWAAIPAAHRPTLRLANLAKLRHPMSVDLYLEQVIAHARCVVIRLLGGLEYWRYGAEEAAALCRTRNVPLALLPGDAPHDPALAALSTFPPERLERLSAYLAQGGPENLRRALLLSAHLAGLQPDPDLPPLTLAQAGEWPLNPPEISLSPRERAGVEAAPQAPAPWATAAIVFYRSHLQAGDIAPIEALSATLRARGITPRALYAASLKEPACAALIADRLRAWRPNIILNATSFSARRDDLPISLEAANVPILQLVLSGSPREAWAASSRGLSPTDLAMNVVLPEIDGRLLTTAISFKAEQTSLPGLEYARTIHAPDLDGIAAAADRAEAWARLATTPRADRHLAIVLSNYPGSGQIGHAVGLDTFASLALILELLQTAGYDAAPLPQPALESALCHAPPTPILTAPGYRRLFQTLPEPIRRAVTAAWGEPDHDILLRHLRVGPHILAVQPDRGAAPDRKAEYHDPDRPPRHEYVAFHLWLRHIEAVHAIVHLGAHGTLEWLPGKAAALSPDCFPAALTGGLPVIYPFIANNPGEAAAAKRRLGAVTIGHLTPPLRDAGTYGAAAELEPLIDEYAAADGMDRRRNALLRRAILERAEAAGLLAESGASPDLPEDDRLARLDAYLCDVKDAQIRDGLHIFGRDPAPDRRATLLQSLSRTCGPIDPSALDRSATSERANLLAALDGHFVPPGPAGAPTRGRADVLPTGRNLFTSDPRLIPTPTAITLAEKSAAELLLRHLQDHGEHLRTLILNVWASAAMRTGGEDLALALLLLGVRPQWDSGSGRVTGFEIVPLALLDRPRVDVTLRVSGLFRDAFAAQIALFDAAARAVAARDEAPDWNPLVKAPGPRVFGPTPGAYGALSDPNSDRETIARAYLAASATPYGNDTPGPAFPDRVSAADAYLHVQDHRETDLLEGPEWAAHEGGFAAAADLLGRAPALYHADTGRPDTPAIRSLPDEIARITRARAANPAWIAGMMRHGYRGAAEIARAVDALFAFAVSVPHRFDPQFELLFAASIGDPAVDAFLSEANPEARAAITARFREARRRDLWRARRNDLSPL